MAAVVPLGSFTLYVAWTLPPERSFVMLAVGALLFLLALLIAVSGNEYLVARWQRRLQSRVIAGTAAPSAFAQPLPPGAPADIAAMDAAVAAIVQGKASAEQLLREVTDENEQLHREVQHRVKNNMQIVASLLNLHASASKEDRGAGVFAAAVARINALAAIHREMYAAEVRRKIDLVAFLNGLFANSNRNSASQDRVHLATETGNIFVAADKALPLGMLLLEVVAQAIDSPGPGIGKALAMGVTLRLQADGRISMVLSYPDTVPEWLPHNANASLGQTLAGAYVRQLGAELATTVLDTKSSLSICLPAGFNLDTSE